MRVLCDREHAVLERLSPQLLRDVERAVGPFNAHAANLTGVGHNANIGMPTAINLISEDFQ